MAVRRGKKGRGLAAAGPSAPVREDTDTIETNFNLRRHSTVTALRQDGAPAGEAGANGRRFVYMYRKATFRRVLLGSVLLGCAASFLDGMMASLSFLGTV